jgi:Ca-activated chloride channel family protein
MRRALFGSLAALGLVTGLNLAQAPTPTPTPSAPDLPEIDDESQILTIDVQEVPVPFTVVDGDGERVVDLTEADVRVYEDGVRQEITGFEAQTELPLTLVLAMDTSNSVRRDLAFEQEAAIVFFFTVIQRRRDQAMLVTFDSSVQVIEDFTDSPEALAEATRKIRAGGSSALYDAIYLAVTQRVAAQPPGARRVMVVISDGDDNASQKTREEALEVALRHNVVIYTISTNSQVNFGTDRELDGDKLLRDLAEETGGRAFYPAELDDLAQALDETADDLREQYYLSYVSSNPLRDGSYRRIDLRVVDLSLGYTVTARKGYYASRD